MRSKIKWLLCRNGFKTELRAKKNRWPGEVELGSHVAIGRDSVLDRYMGGSIDVGDDCRIHNRCKIATCGGNIKIGKGSVLGDGMVITAQGGVEIGEKVLFADNVTMVANEHNYKDITLPIMDQGGYCKPIKIGNGCWIGINATILQGTTVGNNCVVAAGSVVKGSFPDYCVIGGIPARILKQYDLSTGEWR